MKKFFLTGILSACLLVSTGVDVFASPERINFELTDDAVKTEVTGTGLDEVKIEKTTRFTRNSIDWNSAPRFNDFDSLTEYLNNNKNRLQTYLPVVCIDGLEPDSRQIVDRRGIWVLSTTNYGDGCILYEITNYPGERVAWAYRNNNTSFLSNEEKQLYNLAVKIVNDAKAFSSDPLYQELYIHDRITERATYYTENPQPMKSRFQTAIGALIDGKANCQGYTDAFYMLATMCGFNVDKISGNAGGGGHAWNSISFNNGSYFVDVTWDDANCIFDNEPYNTYIYFNVPTNVIGADHQWYVAHVPQNLLKDPDGRNFYRSKGYSNSNGRYFGGWSKTAEDALGHIAYRIAKQGYNVSRMEAPYNQYYNTDNNAINYVINRLNEYGWHGSVSLIVQPRGNYMYITAKATKR